MSSKLQELTDKLYQEGLSKGKQEGDRYLSDAKIQANEIVSKAKAEAEAIITAARKQADDLRAKTESDVRTASQQCLQATKKDIENVLVKEISASKVKDSLSDASFLKEIIKAVAVNFKASDPSDIALVLPESLKKELEPWVNSELKKALGTGIKADFSKKVAGGFTIGPVDGGWFISMTDDSFNELIAEYLRPVTRKLIFGE